MWEPEMKGRRFNKPLVVCLLVSFVQMHIATCSHHKQNCMNTTAEPTVEATGSKRADLIAAPITFAASLASTYLQKFLLKERAAVLSVVNLSDDYYIADGCDTAGSTHIDTPPGNLNPRTGSTEIEVHIESKKKAFQNWLMSLLPGDKSGDKSGDKAEKRTSDHSDRFEDFKASLRDLVNKGQGANGAQKRSSNWQEMMNKNLEVRCSFSKRMEEPTNKKMKTARVIFFMTLRGGRNKDSRLPTSMNVAMCEDEVNPTSKTTTGATTSTCKEYTFDKMKKPIVDWVDQNKKRVLWEGDKPIVVGNADSLKPLSNFVRDLRIDYPDMAAEVFEKTMKKIDKQQAKLISIDPVYYCNDKVKNCVSAIMGNGGEIVAELAIHNYYKADEFIPSQSPPQD